MSCSDWLLYTFLEEISLIMLMLTHLLIELENLMCPIPLKYVQTNACTNKTANYNFSEHSAKRRYIFYNKIIALMSYTFAWCRSRMGTFLYKQYMVSMFEHVMAYPSLSQSVTHRVWITSPLVSSIFTTTPPPFF